jgi:hypothetical protein
MARPPGDAERSKHDAATAIVASPSRPTRSSVFEASQPIALAIAALVLFSALGNSGIWDPYELDAADLARRVAIHVFGARGLELPGAVNSLPTLTDLEMGELPFTSMALGFDVFGLRAWSGRLPLALWAFAGAVVLYHFLARLIDRRAGLYGTLVLVTMPLYFMQARTMLGDIVTMAALAMGFCGLAGALFDDGGVTGTTAPGDRASKPAGANLLARGVWLVIGLFGLVAGYLCRGALIGVAVPALSVGLAWAVLRLSADPGPAHASGSGATPAARRSALPDAVGALALVVGLGAVIVGVRALGRVTFDMPLARELGVVLIKKPPVEATFDLTIRQLGHALFPWSALLPFAVGRLFRAPLEIRSSARDRETGVRVALLIGAGLAVGVFTFLAPRTGALPFTGAALLAGIVAIAVVDLERGAMPSRALALGVVLLAIVLYRDMALIPDKALSVFVVDKPTFPKSFEDPSGRAMKIVVVVFASLAALSWFEAQPGDVDRGLGAMFERRQRQLRVLFHEVTSAWNGNLVFALIVVEAAFIGLGAMLFFGRRLGWAPLHGSPKLFTDFGLNAWWAAPPLVTLLVPLWYGVRDLFSFVTHHLRLPRATWTTLAGVLAGGALSFWYYPALAAQLSPKEVFESYAKLGAGEPLGLVGVRDRSAAYYHVGDVRPGRGVADVESFGDATRAFSWLTERMDQRRWLIVKADDLTRLNSLFRKQAKRNLPVLDGRSSQILLVSNQLGDRPNESWLGRIVLDEAPPIGRPLDAMFEDQLQVLGWEVRDQAGNLVTSVVPQTTYGFRTYYQVLRPVTGTWKSFIHIDGQQRRFNGDHAVLDGKYPMSLWQPGDVIVDDYEFQLEPNFTPGDYGAFFGFFSGETRFRVTRGDHHENRINAGALRVR